MEIHVLDIGNRASTIIRHDDNRITMIDGGINPSRKEIDSVGYLRNVLGIRDRLLRFVATNLSTEFIKGLYSIWRETRFYNFWHNDVLPRVPPHNDEDAQFLYDLILKRIDFACHTVPVVASYKTNLSALEVLSPSQSLKANAASRSSDVSLVLLSQTSYKRKILIVGDIGPEVWRELCSDRSTVVKMMNSSVLIFQGSLGAAMVPQFALEIIQPQVVVCDKTIFDPASNSRTLLSLEELGRVVIEDDCKNLNVYVFEPDVAMGKLGFLIKHPIYEAWLYASVNT